MTLSPRFYRKLAQCSLGAALLALIFEGLNFFHLFTQITALPVLFVRVILVVLISLSVLSLLTGILALIGIKKHGKAGIFRPALAGLILSSLLLTPRLLLFGAVGYGHFDEWRYQPATFFDSARWQRQELKYRYSVLDSVIRSVIKPGMTEEEVTQLLGTPEAISADGDWQYETQRPGWSLMNWTGGGLLIKFDRDRRVLEAINNTFID